MRWSGYGERRWEVKDPTKTAKETDVVATGGRWVEKGVTYRGFDEIKGDVSKLCLNGGNLERSREFAIKPGTPLRLIILKREKP